MFDYVSRTGSSYKMFEKARKVLPGGVSYSIRYFNPYPIYVSRARGQKIWDIDGNEFTDYWMGHGAKLMGHSYPPVVEAVKKQIELGGHFGLPHEWEVKLAEKICSMVPSIEMVRFTNSGTEANMYAVRLARAYTKKNTIIKFEGCWHGGYDALHIAVKPPYRKPPAGVLEESIKHTLTLPYNDLESIERAVKNNGVAGIVVEPVAGAGGMIPADKDFLKGLREICSEENIVLIFDEVITGFRLSEGGAQKIYNVIPDVTILGKIVGGGEFAVGAFGGKTEIMELLDQLKYPNYFERVFQGGTFSANPLMTCAGYTLLSEIEKNLQIYAYLEKLGEKLRREIREIFQEKGITCYTTGIGSLIGIHFTQTEPRDVKTAQLEKDHEKTRQLFIHLLNNQIIALTEDSPHLFLSSSHTTEDVENLLKVIEDFAKRLR